MATRQCDSIRWRRDPGRERGIAVLLHAGTWGGTTEVVAELAHRIEYSPTTEQHLLVLTARQRAIVFDAVDEQLTHQSGVETRNRNPMRPNPVAPWELRIGDLRVGGEGIEL